MGPLARLVTLLLAAALVGACFLPWAGSNPAHVIALRSLVDADAARAAGWSTSLALPLCVCAGLALLAALFAGRPWAVVGGLLAVAVTAVWLLVNVFSGGGHVSVRDVGVGAWGTLVVALLLLVLAGAAADPRRAEVL